MAAHGNFDSATCISTGRPVPIEEVRDAIMGTDPDGWKRLRDRHGGLVSGLHIVSQTAMAIASSLSCRLPSSASPQVKPDIVFFGERLPDRFYRLAGAGAPPPPPASPSVAAVRVPWLPHRVPRPPRPPSLLSLHHG